MTGMLSEEHERWLVERGLDLEVATNYGLYTDRQSQGGLELVIPYRRNDEVINHKRRGPEKRFRQDSGAPRSFWNEDCLRDPTLAEQPILITEGELDALAAIQAGYPRVLHQGTKSHTRRFHCDLAWIIHECRREAAETEVSHFTPPAPDAPRRVPSRRLLAGPIKCATSVRAGEMANS